ncbi:penicillin-binding transpeptidase domain-containing protein [Streptomyces sp. NBC_00433]
MPVARRVKIGIVGGVFTAMVAVAAVGAYNIYTALDSGEGGSTPGTGTQAAAAGRGVPDAAKPLTRKEISAAASDFLAAWSSGDSAAAGALTDSPATASGALASYATGAHIDSVRITPGAATSGGEHFTVAAHITYQALTSTWTYGSSLTVARNAAGDPAVAWSPSVLYPGLSDGDTLLTSTEDAPDLEVTDRGNTVLTGAAYPSLTRIIADLGERYGKQLSGGTPSVGTWIRKADGSTGQPLHVLRKGSGVRLRTTLDATLQAAAEKAVAGKSGAGVTALDTRSGAILAIAYSPADGEDTALMEASAPGSTFKIVTAAALLNSGMTPSSPARCLSQDNIANGRTYHNDTPTLHKADATLGWDFAQSCNTGFIHHADALGPHGLRDTAAKFGLTQEWNVGTPTAEGQPSMPDTSVPDELTSEMIGQGELQMSPLVMASVAATAASGDFHQPLIVDRSLVQEPIAKASGLSSGTSAALRQMMRSAITTGTASAVMRGFGPDSGAKTGSAEVSGQDTTNGWFTAYAGHVAAAAVVHDAGHGNTSAGPIVAAVLRAG